MRQYIVALALAVHGLVLASCGWTSTRPLADAADAGNQQLALSLLRDGADPNGRNGNGLTPIICAARAGRIDVIRSLAAYGADPNLRGGVTNWTPIMHAIHKNQASSVDALLDLSADPNARITHNETALMMAAGYGQSETVRLLLRRGADPRARTVDGETALSMAVAGVSDIDCFTVGRCQTATVHALLEAAPDMAPSVNSWARAIARVGGCIEVLNLLDHPPAKAQTPSRK